jgi:indolepyruvate ferredoxin oxidoreductase alpha subunit
MAADIGCHAFATFEPFSMGHSILGYGMSLASRAGVSPMMQRRTHGGHGRRRLLAQRPAHRRAERAVQRRRRGAADHEERLHLGHRHAGHHLHARRRGQGRWPSDKQLHQSLAHTNQTIEATLKGLGVQWLRTVHTYEVATMRARCRRPSPATSTA